MTNNPLDRHCPACGARSVVLHQAPPGLADRPPIDGPDPRLKEVLTVLMCRSCGWSEEAERQYE